MASLRQEMLFVWLAVPKRRQSNRPTLCKEEEILGGKDVLAGKLKLAFEPSERFRADFTYEYVDDDSESVATAQESPSDEGYLMPLLGFPGIADQGWGEPLVTGYSSYGNLDAIDINGGHQVDVDGIYLTMTFNFGDYTLKSITGVREQEEILASNYLGDAYQSLYDASRNSLRDQTQQEFRLVTDFEGRFNL